MSHWHFVGYETPAYRKLAKNHTEYYNHYYSIYIYYSKLGCLTLV